MARYIKANYKVARHLRLERDRNQLKDGNYLLWQADMLNFGKLIDLPQILEQIGGIALLAHEAREEQDGSVLRELPVATDPRFIIEKPEDKVDPGMTVEPQPEAETEQPAPTEPEAEKKAEQAPAEEKQVAEEVQKPAEKKNTKK